MIDLEKEELVPFGTPRRLPGKPSRQRLVRWMKDGVTNRRTGKKVYLEVIYIGRLLHTSAQAYKRFLKELNKEE